MIFNVSGGGGTALNFRVVGGTIAPTNPAENCIWVNTDTPITSWIFSATEPSPAEAGMVWFSVGTSSPVEFNALKKNGIMVYPLSAKQYVGGAWVDKTAKSYQGGEWVEWIQILYSNGVFNVQFNARSVGNGQFANVAAPTVIEHENYVTVKPTDTGAQNDGIWQSEPIFISGKSALVVTFIGGNPHNNWAYFGLSQVEPVNGNLNAIAQKTYNANLTEDTLDVSGLNGYYYLWFHVGQQTGSTYAYFDISDIRIL